MKVSKSDESSLLIALTEGLQHAKVTYYNYISLPQDWEEGVKSNLDDDFRKSLYTKLDDGGLESLIQRVLFREFLENSYDIPEKESSKNLTSYKAFSDPLKVARNLVALIKDSPKTYKIVAPTFLHIYKDLDNSSFPIKVSDRMSLVCGKDISDGFETKCDDINIDKLYTSYYPKDESARNIDPEKIYIVYMTSGIVSDRTKPKCFTDFYDDVRAFYGACISFGIFYYFVAPSTRQPIAVIANLVDSEKMQFRHCEVADSDISDGAALMCPKAIRDKLAGGSTILDILSPVLKLFSSNESQRLKTAAIWLLRANRSGGGMDKILDATIAIEVLLGDREASDRVGLSKLMANRCAYSLGKSSSERKQIFDFFIKFYKVRSDIVHSGRLKLLEEEQEVVDRGSELAARILRHETDIS